MSPEFVVAPNGLLLPTIKAHSLDKLERHDYFTDLFARAMRKRFPNLVYIGLYSGAGSAVVEGTGELVRTSAMTVLTQEVPFTKYIFVDSEERCIEALQHQIEESSTELDYTLIHGDVNDVIGEVIGAMPAFSPPESGLLGLCFIDPFKANLDFDVIRRLSKYWMDFLIMLPFGHDIRRNWRRYLYNEDDERIGRLIGDLNWREKWRAQGRSHRHFIRFLLEEFDIRMQELGYRERDIGGGFDVKVKGLGVYLYSLVFYSRRELGAKFWKAAVKGTTPQLDLLSS